MITVQFKIVPTTTQAALLRQTTAEYISVSNDLIDYCLSQTTMPRLSSATFCAALPSAVKSEVTLVVKSILKKHGRGKCKRLPVLKKPVATWNNQNYKILDAAIVFPVWLNGKSQRISVAAEITEYQRERLSGKLGALRITQKSGKWIAQVAVTEAVVVNAGSGVIGVDLGLKIPAVAVTELGKTRFCGNGRMNKYQKRKHRARRRALGKAKKQKVIDKLNNKEQRWMRDQDHKISRQLVNFAIEQNVGVIRMEQLQNIRKTARTSRKNAKNLHTWSFYRLASYIEYKAKMAGIEVAYVNPAYTSQVCPNCGAKNHAKDRNYTCKCGYSAHRDRVGAQNIIYAPVIAGKRQSA